MSESALGKVANVAVIVAAVALTWRIVAGASHDHDEAPVPAPIQVSGWDELISGGHREGDLSAPVQIVVFEDFQCPVCGKFAVDVLPDVVESYTSQIAVTFRHFPLSYHPLAVKAAVLSECAGEQGKYSEVRRALFEQQHQISDSTLIPIALVAGVPDSAALRGCVSDARNEDTVMRDLALAQQQRLPGTPSILVNGYLLSVPPERSALSEVIDSILSGR